MVTEREQVQNGLDQAIPAHTGRTQVDTVVDAHTAGRHTPGPWVRSGYGAQVLTGDSWNTICVLVEPKKDHRSASWEDGRAASHFIANAALIAAAPDLLAALKLVVANVEEYERVNNLAPNPGRLHCWDSVAQAHAAIAKAEDLS